MVNGITSYCRVAKNNDHVILTRPLSTLGTGQFVQINGLPLSSGGLRATRIEKIAAPVELITTGPIANLNTSS